MKTLLTAPDIEYLRGQQMKLDEDIIRKNGITHDEWMDGFETKHYLALRVEVHEFINECYDVWKYWKSKPVDRERIIDEAVDILHFVCLHWNKDADTVERNVQQLEISARVIKKEFGDDTAEKLGFLSCDADLAGTLAGVLSILDDHNFTTQDIIDAYNRKNKINFERLNSGTY